MKTARKKIVMIGTDFETQGGVASVVNVYRSEKLFEKWPIEYISTHRTGSNKKKILMAMSAFLRFMTLLVTGQVEIVHAHVSYGASFWRKSFFLFPAMIAKKPVIFHLHGSEFMPFYEKRSGVIGRWWIRFIMDRMARIVVLSSQWREMVKRITSNSEVKVVFNPILFNKDRFVPDEEREKQTILFLGKLGKRKGTYDLVDAICQLIAKHPSVKLLCAGDGDLDQIREYSTKLGIERNIKILGWVKGRDKQKLLDTAGIFALPSYFEGLPMGILEAMSEGLPIVSTYTGGIPDAIENGVEGFLVQAGDVKSLTEALDKLLADPKLRKAMGEAGRRKVESKFSPEQILPQVEAIYYELGVSPNLSIK